ncbi:MAG TPA: MazG family protein [Pseudonocardia sp.]|nr:MazG family protein [Pseudonocardia sp.]
MGPQEGRTVVVLAGTSLPVSALPALRAASRVVADATVPDDLAAAAGAQRAEDPGAGGVLLTTDPARAAGAATVVLADVRPGSALLDAVAVMDRLRSPGGCPWDAEQTHHSLLQYLVEECYELYQAIEDGDREATREELGDVLLQVLFHARIAAEDAAAPFDIDDVAAELVAKLVGRHPHVFAGTERIETAARQEHRWEELKRGEKQRESSVDGVPLGQPAVALAAKLTSRTARAGLPPELLPSGSGVGEQLFALAARAKLAGVDPEAELRGAARRFAEVVRTAERAARADGLDPHGLDADAWRRYWPAEPGPGTVGAEGPLSLRP